MTGNADQRAFLGFAFQNASSLAHNAASQLQNLGGPQEELFTWIFGPVNRVPIARGAFERIGTLTQPKEQELDGTDVRVYCTDARLKCKKDPNDKSAFPFKCFDPDSGNYYKRSTLHSCNRPTMAFTLRPSVGFGQASAITFCPWFLDYAMRQDHRFMNEVRMRKFKDFAAEMDIGKFLKPLGLRTPIDFFNLFDGTVIHELSHTVHGGLTQDVKYGWKGCREISQRESDVDKEEKGNGPLMNADSFGLFAVASKYIAEGGTVTEDGKLQGGRIAGSTT